MHRWKSLQNRELKIFCPERMEALIPAECGVRCLPCDASVAGVVLFKPLGENSGPGLIPFFAEM